MKRESAGLVVWRVIYPLLIFLGVDVVLEMIIMIGFIALKLPQVELSAENYVKIVEDATNYLMSMSIYITIVRAAIIVPLYALFMKQDKHRDQLYGRAVKYTNYNKGFLGVVALVGIGSALGFNVVVPTVLSIIQELINMVLSNFGNFKINLFASFEQTSEMIYAGPVWLQIFATAIVAPVMEEFLFRGLVYKRIRTYLKFVPTMLISSAIFGLMHGNIVQFFYAFMIGMALAFVYEKFKNLWAPIIFHASANLISILLTNLVPQYFELPTYLQLMFMVVELAVAGCGVYIIHRKVSRSPVNMMEE